MRIKMNYLNGLRMLVFNIVVLSLLPIVNAHCQCYEAMTGTRDIYVLYEDGSVYTLEYFSYFHGEYTPFRYAFSLSKDDSEIQVTETLMTITRKDTNFYIKRNVGTAEFIIKLSKKNCNRLKVNKIPKERILKNPNPIEK